MAGQQDPIEQIIEKLESLEESIESQANLWQIAILEILREIKAFRK